MPILENILNSQSNCQARPRKIVDKFCLTPEQISKGLIVMLEFIVSIHRLREMQSVAQTNLQFL